MAKPTKAALQVENWNLKHPVGTPVTVRRDGGEVERTVTTSEAYLMGHGAAVIHLENVRGCFLLDRVKPIVREADHAA